MTTVKQSGSTTIATYTYNTRTDVESRTNGGETSTYSYDNFGRLSSMLHNLSGAPNDVTLNFNIWNAANQLVERNVTNDAYAFTPIANINQAYEANGLNQYSAVAGAAHTYDANGNLTSDGSTTYGYDVENRLTSGSGAKTATLVYDPLGRLFETSGAGGANLTRFLYDGDELVAEYNTSGTMLRRFVHGSGVDDPIVWYEGSGFTTRRHLLANEQGSPIAITDSGGNLVQANAWDEYGVPKAGNLGRFGYTGQIWIPELALWHYKARAYSPTLGRFMQTDPVGYDGGVNLYAYVGDDPVNGNDPLGTQSVVGTFSIETPCRGSEPCIRGYREGQQAIGKAAIDFLFGDWISAYHNPTATNISIAAVLTFLPEAKAAKLLSKGGIVARKMGITTAMRASSKSGGVRWVQGSASVRISRGNPLAREAHLREPSVKVTNPHGGVYDKFGNIIEATPQLRKPSLTREAHIPIDEFDPSKFPSFEKWPQ